MSNLRRVLMSGLDKMFDHKSDNNLSEDTAFSVTCSTFSMVDAQTAAGRCDALNEILRDPHIINLYGPYAVTISRNSDGAKVFVFVRVPDVEDIVQLEKV